MLRLYGQKDLQQRLEKTFVSVHLKIIIDSCSMTSLKTFHLPCGYFKHFEKIIGKEVIKIVTGPTHPTGFFFVNRIGKP